MKFVIQRELLMESLQHVMKAVSSRTAIPILTGIKLEAYPQGIKLTGSDSDISIESFIPVEEDGKIYVENIESGSVVLQAKYFPEIIRKLPKQIVEIEVDDHFNVNVRSGSAEFHLNGQDADEYPHLPEVEIEESFSISSDLLKDLVKQTVFAVSASETRPILTGVNVSLRDGKLSFVATDSHRLASRKIPVTGNLALLEEKSIVIPGKSLNELNKILDDNQEMVHISLTQNQILFKTKNLHFLSRLLEGNYPETSRLIPDQSKTIVVIDTKDLLHVVDRASLLAKENQNNVVKLVTKVDKLIEISSNSPEIGKVVESIEAKRIDGEELKISFSAKYLIDALRVINNTQVKIEFTGAMRPFLIRPLDDEDLLQLILPVRTY
ncbi:DNA polymerase III subunit beta [Bacillaceae bacterium S4-13-58]